MTFLHSRSYTSLSRNRVLLVANRMAAPLRITPSTIFATKRLSLLPRAFASLVKGLSEGTTLTRQELKEQGILYEHAFCVNFTTLHTMQRNACMAFANRPLFGTFSPTSQKFEWITFHQFSSLVNIARSVLQHDLGCTENSKIGIISNNRWEWAAIACAAYSMKAAVVPMYEAQLPSDWKYILNDAGCDALFCASEKIFEVANKEVVPDVETLKGNMCFDSKAGVPYGFQTALAEAKKRMQNTPGGFNMGINEPSIDDLADLIYTSGTTGKPKGVELTHENIAQNIQSIKHMISDPNTFMRPDDRSLAFLPWAHVYGQTCELWAGMAHGGSIGICRGTTQIVEDLSLVKPTILFSVPTLYKRVYDGVGTMIQNSSPLKQKLMNASLRLAREDRLARESGNSLGFFKGLQFKALNGLVLDKIRARFGGNLRFGFLGGAACPREILEFMDDLGIPIYEGYGLTETSPIITLNVPGQRKLGTIGKPIPKFNVVICDESGNVLPPGTDGEICCYGPSVMRGYYNKPEETSEVISVAPDGVSRMFHTGDMGQMAADGFVKITGRIKEQYKLENGKYVVPSPIEEAISMSRFIRQVVVCGSNRPYNVCLIVPEWDVIRSALKIDPSTSEEELAGDPRVQRLIDSQLDIHLANLKKYERPLSWAFVAPFTAANNMLTPKMSIRRHIVVRTYEDVIAGLYHKARDESHKDQQEQAEKMEYSNVVKAHAEKVTGKPVELEMKEHGSL
mmetsp:Transcript_3418/g.5059  ORF Transcript_3418/g.5059 Transcript_3418/m.5059 type:complete len:738 (+) Transcript_3418:49-2262(+)